MLVVTHRLVEYAKAVPGEPLRLDWTTADSFLRSPEGTSVLALTSSHVKLSIDGFDYLNPDGLIWVLLFGEYLARRENVVWLQLPKNERQLGYIKGASFHWVAEGSFHIDDRYLLEGTSPWKLTRGMQFFSVEPESLNEILREINALVTGESFRSRLGITFPDSVRFQVLPPFVRTVVETVKNIVQHSGPQSGSGSGYFVIGPAGSHTLRLCVGDVGRGFAASLADKGIRTANDQTAIKAALMFGYEGREGEGLFRVVEFMSRFKGSLRVRSGTAVCALDVEQPLDNDQSIRDCIVRNVKGHQVPVAFPGVQIMVDFRYKKEHA